MAPNPTGASLRAKYDFRWEVLDVIVAGKSSIDASTGFQLGSLDEVTRFLSSYGYDIDNPIEQAELLGNYQEAMNLVKKYFLQPENPDGLKLEVPRRLLELTDVRDLFLMASMSLPGQNNDNPGQALQDWSCSILKIMHTIAHIDKDLRASYFSDIQKQIFDRFYKSVHRDHGGQLFLGEGPEDPFRIDLVAFETKPKKSRESSILKLLHKPENVAEDLFDRVGIRFVTQTLLDALRVVKFLKDRTIVMPPNIKPSRSRNTLIDLDLFRSQLGECMSQVESGALSETEVVAALSRITQAPAVNPENPHSSEFYRAIQFTCRQLIKLRNPLYADIKELKHYARTRKIDEDFQKAVDRIDLKYLQREVRFFYPYEVQVVDQHSAEENERGRSAHSEYKRAQVQTALKRVMGRLAT